MPTRPQPHRNPPVLLARLRKVMNEEACLSSAGSRSSPANARCAGCLLPFLIAQSMRLHQIPMEEMRWMMGRREL